MFGPGCIQQRSHRKKSLFVLTAQTVGLVVYLGGLFAIDGTYIN